MTYPRFQETITAFQLVSLNTEGLAEDNWLPIKIFVPTIISSMVNIHHPSWYLQINESV